MADLDSKQKRESGFGICLPFTRVGPTADGSDANSEDERAHLVMNYGGIAAGIAAVVLEFLRPLRALEAVAAGVAGDPRLYFRLEPAAVAAPTGPPRYEGLTRNPGRFLK